MEGGALMPALDEVDRAIARIGREASDGHSKGSSEAEHIYVELHAARELLAVGVRVMATIAATLTPTIITVKSESYDGLAEIAKLRQQLADARGELETVQEQRAEMQDRIDNYRRASGES